ncbi:MAG TPA: helix-turn-helix transcriptional regulator [Thermoanaerobaculia bacterium]|nr:helix-turn-helix transcriptional regulator [Thermoanaerobaculia bacterium]
MRTETAVDRLSGLAQASRLEIFRQLVQAGPEGLAAGAIAEALAIPKPTLSFHLAQLERAGLVASRRDGRSILYRADYDSIAELVGFLYDNCCGRGSACAPRPRRTKA